jgi:Rrf2 family protein
MVDLARHHGSQPTPLARVAKRQGISEGYLEQLMIFLRKGGLVRSVRGVRGGYLLMREPVLITAGDVVRCLEGPLNPSGCVSEEEPDLCDRSDNCATRHMWSKVRDSIAGVLDTTTLAELAESENA